MSGHSPERRKKRQRWHGRTILAAACATFLLVVAAWCLLATLVDRHWLGTVLALGPRWLLLVPVLVLAPLATLFHRGAALLLAASGLIAAGPVMDFSVPWNRFSRAQDSEGNLRVLTCNLGGQQDLASFVRLLERQQPAVVACQEWPAGVDWPRTELGRWHVAHDGGLLVASRYPIVSVRSQKSPVESWRTTGLACQLQTERGTLRCVCLHLLTPRSGIEAIRYRGLAGVPLLEDVNRRRQYESQTMSAWVQSEGATLVLADFNMAQESRLYRSDWSTFDNAFSQAGFGWGYTKWTRAFGVRIDHILCRPPWTCSRAWVGPHIGSDHRPLIADLTPRMSQQLQ